MDKWYVIRDEDGDVRLAAVAEPDRPFSDVLAGPFDSREEAAKELARY